MKKRRVVSLAIIIGCDEKLLKKVLQEIKKFNPLAEWICSEYSILEGGKRKFNLLEKENFIIIVNIYKDNSCGLGASNYENIPLISLLMTGKLFLAEARSLLRFNQKNSREI